MKEKQILKRILECYIMLSPENLHRDGEATRAEAMRSLSKINKELRLLFSTLGRVVTEEEAYRQEV